LVKREEQEAIMEEEETQEYRQLLSEERQKLLALYVVAIRDQIVTSERNPAMYAIASSELKRFMLEKKV
jgi:hypothetical protein